MPFRAALPGRSTTPPFPRALLACLALVLGASGLAGCTATPAPHPGPTTPGVGVPSPGPLTHYSNPPAALQENVDCLATSFGVPPSDTPAPGVVGLMGSVPRGFVPVDVIECTLEIPVPSNATSSGRAVIVEQHLSGDFTALLAALAAPSDRQAGTVCAANLEIIPDLWLVDASGNALHVKWPLDACQKSKPATAKALNALTVSSTTTLPVPAQ